MTAQRCDTKTIFRHAFRSLTPCQLKLVSQIDLSTRYWTAYYWAITAISTVGFGDISAQTKRERVFSIVIEIFGCLLFAVLIGSLGSMMVGQKLLEEKVSRQVRM